MHFILERAMFSMKNHLPSTVRNGVYLIVAGLIVNLALYFLTYAIISYHQKITGDFHAIRNIAVSDVAVIFLAYNIYRRKKWARSIYTVLVLIAIGTTLYSDFTTIANVPPYFLTLLCGSSFINIGIIVMAIYNLYRNESNAWFSASE